MESRNTPIQPLENNSRQVRFNLTVGCTPLGHLKGSHRSWLAIAVAASRGGGPVSLSERTEASWNRKAQLCFAEKSAAMVGDSKLVHLSALFCNGTNQ